MKTWAVEYKEHKIAVKNKVSGADLYLDGKIIDTQKGVFGAGLVGCTPEGDSIHVTLNAGIIKIHCNIYVNDKKIYSND